MEFEIWELEFPEQARSLWVPACPGCGQTKKNLEEKTVKNDILHHSDKVLFRSDKVLLRCDKMLFRSDIVLHRWDKVPYRKDKVSNRSDKLPIGKDKVTVITKFGPGVRSCIQAYR